MKTIDLRQKFNAKAAGVELSTKATTRDAVKQMKKTASFTNEKVWSNKLS